MRFIYSRAVLSVRELSNPEARADHQKTHSIGNHQLRHLSRPHSLVRSPTMLRSGATARMTHTSDVMAASPCGIAHAAAYHRRAPRRRHVAAARVVSSATVPRRARGRRGVAAAAASAAADGGAAEAAAPHQPPIALLVEVDGALTDLVMDGHRCA